MTYSQPDPAEETTADIDNEQPDTDRDELESDSEAETATDEHSENASPSRDTTDDTEGGGQQ